MPNMTFDTSEVYAIPNQMIIGGSYEPIHFNFLDENNEPLDISNAKLTWTLSPFGEPKNTLLTKEGVLAGNYACVVYLNSEDTKNLSGKFIQQLTIEDQAGRKKIPSQGIIKINANNNNN